MPNEEIKEVLIALRAFLELLMKLLDALIVVLGAVPCP